MKRARKRNRAPSVITSDLDRQFSPTCASPELDSTSESDTAVIAKPCSKRRKQRERFFYPT